MGSADRDLLFYETFNHERSQELHVDLIRFPLPVVIKEVRIVSQETKACAEFNKMGQTSPSSFTLNVFCNDSTNPLAPTFDPLGTIEYQDDSVGLVVKTKTSSDLVVVKGYYTVLTLCIYGNVAMPPSLQSPFQPTSPRSARSASRSYSDNSGNSDSGSSYSDTEGQPYTKGGGSPQRGGEGKEEGEGGGGGGGKRDSYVDDLFEPFSPVNSPDHLFELSDEDGKRSSTAAMGYPVEELSDEEIAFEGGDEFDVQEEGFESYMDSVDWMTSGVSFNPYHCDLALTSLESYPSLIETPHEALLVKLQKAEASTKRTVADEASKLRDIVLKTKDVPNTVKWVEMMEEIPSFLYPGLAQLQKRSGSEGKEVMQKLASWTVQCLNLDVAKQSQMSVNIRQLKAGLRMVPSIAALGRRCTHMLVKHNVLEELCYIALANPMVSTIKLQTLRAIDSLLDHPQGLERFLGWNTHSSTPTFGAPQGTPYQQILTIVMSQPMVRVGAAASVLMAKAHIYELLANLQEAVGKVVSCTPVKTGRTSPDDFWGVEGEREGEGEGGEEGRGGGGGEPGETTVSPLKGDKKQSNVTRQKDSSAEEEQEPMEEGEANEATPTPVPPEVINKIASCLEELNKCLKEAHHATVQSSSKAFPTKVLCFPERERDYFPPLIRMFQSRRLLECILVLVTAPPTALDESIFSGVRDLLLFFLSSQEGLLFLFTNTPVMNSITRALTQASENQLALMQTLTELLSGSTADSCTPQNLGLLLIYHLQVLQSLDQLRQAPKSSMTELESTECVGPLHTLYTMTLTPIGKSALSYVLSLKDNITALFPFVESRGQKDHDNKLLRTSVSSRYAAVIILQLLQSPVRGEFLITYGNKLLSVAEFFKDSSSPTMSDLYNWLYPVKNMTPDGSTAIPLLVSTVKDLLPQISFTKPNKIIAPILTSLRLLLTFILPPDWSKGGQKNLKWCEYTIALFSTGAMDVLQTLLQKISDLLLPLWSQQQIVAVSLANIASLVATFALKLIRAMLQELLEGESSYQFSDTRIVGVLVALHAVVCSMPYSSVISNAAPEIQSSILDILVMFTKPEIPEPEGGNEEKPSVDATTSCWCLMIQELLKQTLTTPNCFLSGLMLFSELLPLPLPVQTAQPRSDEDIAHISRLHTLWALHLDPFTGSLSEIISSLLRSSCPELQGLLRRVCAQLADLSPSLATLIARHVIRMIISEIEKQLESPEEDMQKEEGGGGEGEEGMEDTKIVYSCLLRMLTTCAVLSQQVAFKIALLDLLRQKETDDTKSFSRFIPLLLFLMQKKETNIPTKLCIMTILNSLCSTYITFSQGEEMEGAPLTQQQLADCLPGQSQLEHITSAVLSHVTSPDNPLTTVIQGLKVIFSIAQYNAGLVHLFSLLQSSAAGFSQLLERLTEALKKPDSQSSITLDCLSLLLSLYRFLISASLVAKLEGKGRRGHSEVVTLTFPKPLLKALVSGEEERDLLQPLREAVQESCNEDSSLLEELLTPISELAEAFQGVHPAMAELPTLEQEAWPDMQPLKRQFEQRISVYVSEDEGRSPEFWLSTPPHDESEFKPDMTTLDLPKLVSDTIPGLNLEEELKKRLLPSPPPSPRDKKKRKLVVTGPEAQKKLREAMRLRQVAGRGKDTFRLRKQNTSRPPSMHVDDFMAMGPRSQVHRSQLPSQSARSSPMGLPYLPPHHTHHPHPSSSLMHQLSSRWHMSTVTPGLSHYPRRDLAGLSMREWDSSRFPPFMTSTAHLKPPPLRSTPLWPPQLADPYRSRSRSLLPWAESSRSLSEGSSSSRMADLWKSRHLYKRVL